MKRLPIEFRLAIVISALACLFGSLLWIDGHSYFGIGYYWSDAVYKIGSPLTQLSWWYVHRYGILEQADDYWAMPAMNLLLTTQLLLWATLVYAICRFLKKKKIKRKAESAAASL